MHLKKGYIENLGRPGCYALLLKEIFGSRLEPTLGKCSPEQIEEIEKMIASLPETRNRERNIAIVKARFGLEDGKLKSLTEVAKMFDSFYQSIGQIIKKALIRLAHPSRRQRLTFIPSLLKKEKIKEYNKAGEIPIEEIDFSTCAINALKRHGFKTLDDIAKKTKRESQKLPGIGKKTLREIEEVLSRYQLQFCPLADRPKPLPGAESGVAGVFISDAMCALEARDRRRPEYFYPVWDVIHSLEKKSRIETLDQLAQLTEGQLRQRKGFDSRIINVLKNLLANYGLSLHAGKNPSRQPDWAQSSAETRE